MKKVTAVTLCFGKDLLYLNLDLKDYVLIIDLINRNLSSQFETLGCTYL